MSSKSIAVFTPDPALQSEAAAAAARTSYALCPALKTSDALANLRGGVEELALIVVDLGSAAHGTTLLSALDFCRDTPAPSTGAVWRLGTMTPFSAHAAFGA